MIYALIKNSMVQNVIVAEESFVNALIAAGVATSAVLIENDTQRPNIGDSYNNGVFSPLSANLSVAKMQKIALLKKDVDDYVALFYTLDVRVQLQGLYLHAMNNGLDNRKAYLETILTWMNEILAYLATVVAQIQAAASLAALLEIQWDIFGNISPHEKILAATAILIED